MSITMPFQRSALPIGIDFGASSVKIAQLRQRAGGFALVDAARIDAECSLEQLDKPEHIVPLVGALKRRIDSGAFSGGRCVLSVDDRLLRIRSVRQPRMSDEETDRALRLEASGRLGFAEGEAAEIGWLRAGEVRQGEDVREELVVVGSRRGPIETLVFELARAGLQPIAVEPGFQACARIFGRTLRRAEDQSTVRVIVDFGWRSTGVIITRGRTVGFFKPLEVGGAQLNAAAGERLGLEPQAVAELRRQRMSNGEGAGEPVDRKVDRAVFEAVRPIIAELAREVALCLRYYGVTFRGARPDECLVVGGESREPRLVELLNDELRIPVSLAHPLAGIDAGGPAQTGMWKSRDGELAVACGLGLREWEMSDNRRVGRRSGEARRTPGPGAPVGETAGEAA